MKSIGSSNSLSNIFKAVAKLALRNSLRIQDIINSLKRGLIEAATEELEKQGEKVTLSKLSVMTGIHRGEVQRITHDGESHDHQPPVCAKVISRWRQSPAYQTKRGTARVLTVSGANSEFAQLVREVSQDLSPYTVLFELERTGAVVKSRRGVKLQDAVYLIDNSEAGMAMVAADTGDLLESVGENLFENPEIPNLHLKTQYDNIPACYMQMIKEWFLNEGAEFQKRAQAFLAKLDRDENEAQQGFSGCLRAALCTFSRVEVLEKRSKKR
jgi:hypothetical protein